MLNQFRVWFFVCLCIAFVITFGCRAAVAQPLIIDDGKANAEIVIDEAPQRTVWLAAWELQNHMEKISGARLPIVHEPGDAEVQLYVGASAHTDRLGIDNQDLKYGAYRIVSGEDWLVLIGTDT